MKIIMGIQAASGIGVGQAFVLPESQPRKISQRKIAQEEVESEWQRLEGACDSVREDLSAKISSDTISSDQREVFEAYKLMLSDVVFMQELKDFFSRKLLSIEFSLSRKVEEYAQMLRGSKNDFLAARAQDIEDVFNHVLNILTDYHPFDIEQVPEGSVVVARTMQISDTMILGRKKIKGIALTEGSSASHVAIIAKSYSIPVVVGIEHIETLVETGDTVIVNGDTGEFIVNPDTATLTGVNARILSEEKQLQTLRKLKDVPAQTEDGTVFKLMANIGTTEEAEAALENGADGIGLFRTEFLFINEAKTINKHATTYSSSMSEEAQFEAYKRVLQTMAGKPVTIRTLDIGGDKILETSELPAIHEKNPLMGLRAIRMSLYCPAVFRTQLRALYRASVYGDLRILLPLITDVSQLETALGIAKGIRISLGEEGIPFNPDVPIGAMVETAAAAICSDCLAQKAAFFSLGTNDLTQYVLGVDRENQAVAPLYNEFSLAVLRMIRSTIFNANKVGIPISVCGEMAGSKESAVVLAGMGIRELSMAPKQIPVIKEMLSHFSIDELTNLSNRSII